MSNKPSYMCGCINADPECSDCKNMTCKGLIDHLKTHIVDITESWSITKSLYEEVLKQNVNMKQKMLDDKLYWYNRGYFDALREISEEKNDEQ